MNPHDKNIFATSKYNIIIIIFLKIKKFYIVYKKIIK